MGQKLCTGSSDTPLVTFDCTIVNVTQSPNTNVDVTDSPLSGDEEESESRKNPQYRRCCCLLWRRRRQADGENEREKKKGKKEKLQFPVVRST